MSGGHFNHNGYIYYRVQEFIDELEVEILNNERPNEWSAPNLSEETIGVLKKSISFMQATAKLMKAIDYLYSGDYGEDNFLEAVSNIEVTG